MGKKRILFFVESLTAGGAERVLLTILRNINRQKYLLTVIALVDTGIYREELIDLKIDYRPIIQLSTGRLSSLWRQIKYKLIYNYLPQKLSNRLFLPQKGYDVYVAFVEGFSTKWLSHLPKNVRKYAWVHTDLMQYPWPIRMHIYRNLAEERKAYSQYTMTVGVSHSVTSIMQKCYGLPNTITIYNPIETIRIKAMAQADPPPLPSTSKFNIVSVGRLVYQKGYDLLINIVADLIRSGIELSLFIIGEGGDRKHLESIVCDRNMYDSIHLLGFQKNPYSILRKMDLFVCSSRVEGFSLAVAEALILDLPVVSMNCVGPNELLDGGKYGCLCDTYQELFSVIKKAATVPAYYRQLQQQVSDRGNFLDVSTSMKQIERLFDGDGK